MEIDDRMMGYFRGRMDMNFGDSDEDRLEMVQMSMLVVEHLQEAIIERFDAGSSVDLPLGARSAYNRIDETLDYMREIEEKLQ